MIFPLRLAVPVAWKTLLDIDGFSSLSKPPPAWDAKDKSADEVAAHLVDPKPFQNDSRQIRREAGNRFIVLTLESDHLWYRLSCTVFAKAIGPIDWPQTWEVSLSRGDYLFNLPANPLIQMVGSADIPLEIVASDEVSPSDLTELDWEMLDHLLWVTQGDGSPHAWSTVKDCGGTGDSPHGASLAKLAHYGYAECRTNRSYRITHAGGAVMPSRPATTAPFSAS